MIRSVISYPSYLLDYLFKDAVKQPANVTVRERFRNVLPVIDSETIICAVNKLYSLNLFNYLKFMPNIAV